MKSSILQFRNDVQKQAKRIMQSQESMKSSMVFGQYGANSGSSKQAKLNESSSGRYNAWWINGSERLFLLTNTVLKYQL